MSGSWRSSDVLHHAGLHRSRFDWGLLFLDQFLLCSLCQCMLFPSVYGMQKAPCLWPLWLVTNTLFFSCFWFVLLLFVDLRDSLKECQHLLRDSEEHGRFCLMFAQQTSLIGSTRSARSATASSSSWSVTEAVGCLKPVKIWMGLSFLCNQIKVLKGSTCCSALNIWGLLLSADVGPRSKCGQRQRQGECEFSCCSLKLTPPNTAESHPGAGKCLQSASQGPHH